MSDLMYDDTSLLTDFFSELEERSIPYCVVGDTALLPQIPDNDIDIICPPRTLELLRCCISRLATRHGGRLVQLLQHESNAYYHVLWFPLHSDRSIFLKIDVCTNYIRGGRLFLTADRILDGRTKVGPTNKKECFYRASAEREFNYYILKKIDKGHAEASALRHLAVLFAQDPKGCREVLKRYWPDDSAALIEIAVKTENWGAISTHLKVLRRQAHSHLPDRRIAFEFAEVKRKIHRLLKPTGFVIAVLGPDGAGKSTLLTRLVPSLEALGRRSFQFHLKPPLLRANASYTVVTDPHAQNVRGIAPSILKLLYFVLVYNLGWLGSVWWPRRQSCIIYFDRYYHDILADPRRYRNGTPDWIVMMLGRLIPKPDLFLILDVGPEIAQGRKEEVSLVESRRQFVAYRELSAQISNAKLIDANLPPENVSWQCQRAIVEAMSARLAEPNGCHP